VLREVVKARDLLDAAHLLIQADRRVETYRNQALELVHAQGSLRVARALVQSTDPGKRVFEVGNIGPTLKEVFKFVEKVTEEYREKFMEVAKGEALGSIESLPSLQHFLDRPTFEAEVQLKLRDVVKSIQTSSGGVRTTTPR
jgi:nucleoside-diphosphate-sugar epimerase